MGSLLKFVWPPLCLPEISWTCSPGCQSASKALACQFQGWAGIPVCLWSISLTIDQSPGPLVEIAPICMIRQIFRVQWPLPRPQKGLLSIWKDLAHFCISFNWNSNGAPRSVPGLNLSTSTYRLWHRGHLARRGVITEPGKPDYGPRQSYNYTLAHFSSTIFSERNSGYLECQDIKCTMTVWIVHLRSSEIYIKGNLSPSFVREKFWMRVASDEGNKRIRAISAKCTHGESEDRMANSAQQQQ